MAGFCFLTSMKIMISYGSSTEISSLLSSSYTKKGGRAENIPHSTRSKYPSTPTDISLDIAYHHFRNLGSILNITNTGMNKEIKFKSAKEFNLQYHMEIIGYRSRHLQSTFNTANIEANKIHSSKSDKRYISQCISRSKISKTYQKSAPYLALTKLQKPL